MDFFLFNRMVIVLFNEKRENLFMWESKNGKQFYKLKRFVKLNNWLVERKRRREKKILSRQQLF